jgi:hypothetical protein
MRRAGVGGNVSRADGVEDELSVRRRLRVADAADCLEVVERDRSRLLRVGGRKSDGCRGGDREAGRNERGGSHQRCRSRSAWDG